MRGGVQVLNIHYDLLVKLDDVFIMNVELTTKTSTNAFKNVVFNISANLCGNLFETPLIKMLTPLVDKFAPGLIHECPYYPKKNFGIHDFTIDASLIPLIPIGTFERIDYKVFITYLSKQRQVILSITIWMRFGPKAKKRKSTEKPASK